MGKVTTEFTEHFDQPTQLGRVPTTFTEHFDQPTQRGRVATEFIEHFDQPVDRGRVPTLFAEVFWEFPGPVSPVAIVPNISGNTGVPATFDGSGSTGSIDGYRWSWVSVPGGSAITNVSPDPFPNNGVTTWISMTGNSVLYHGEGSNADSSGNGNSAVLNNIGYAAGQVGAQSFDFLGPNSTVQPTNLIPTVSGVWSASFWFYDLQPNATWRTGLRSEDGANDHPFIIETGTDRAGFYKAGSPGFLYANFDMPSAAYAGWHHLVVVSTGSVTQYYIDGEFKGYAPAVCTTGLRSFGNLNALYGGGQRFALRIDEVAVWSRALSFSEVADIYAVQSAAYAGTGPQLTFTPDVAGVYTVDLQVRSTVYGLQDSTQAQGTFVTVTTSTEYGIWPQERNDLMIDVQGQRMKRHRGQL